MEPADEGGRRWFSYPVEASDQPTLAIVDAVARVTGRDAYQLEPMSGAIDTDALNDLFSGRTDRREFTRAADEPTPADLLVEFRYEGCVVAVSPGRFTVSDPA